MSELPFGMEASDDPNDEGRALRNQLKMLEEQQRRVAMQMAKRPDDVGMWLIQTKLSTSITSVARMLLSQGQANRDKVEDLTWEEKQSLVKEMLKDAPPEIKAELARHLSLSAAATKREAHKNATGEHAGRFAPGSDPRRAQEGGISTGPGSRGGAGE